MNSDEALDEVPLYRGKPLLFSLEPIALKKKFVERVETAMTAILKSAEDFTKQALKDPALLKRLGVPEDLDPTPTPLGLHIPFARFDLICDGQNFQFLELNTDGTSGYNISEWLNHEAGISENEDPNLGLSEKLLHALRQHAPQAPEVVIMDFREVGTSWEQKDLVKRWQKSISCHLADPGVRSWRENSLVYRRALSWQLRSQAEKSKAFLKDWRDKKVTVVGGWSSDVGMSKAWPAFVKPDHCPDTHLLDEGFAKTIASEKDNWVLKGALSYSGNSVLRGMDLTETRWMSSLNQLAAESKSGRPWIAQRRVEMPLWDSKPMELGLFFLNGQPSGYMCRWGHDEPISETSGEILRPVKIIS